MPFQGSPRTLFNSPSTNLSSGDNTVQQSRFLDYTFREDDVLVRHGRLAHPDSVTPSLIQVAGRHGCVLVHHSVLQTATLGLKRPSQRHAQMQFCHRSSPDISSGSTPRDVSAKLPGCCGSENKNRQVGQTCKKTGDDPGRRVPDRTSRRCVTSRQIQNAHERTPTLAPELEAA